jgi:hypothetical protein
MWNVGSNTLSHMHQVPELSAEKEILDWRFCLFSFDRQTVCLFFHKKFKLDVFSPSEHFRHWTMHGTRTPTWWKTKLNYYPSFSSWHIEKPYEMFASSPPRLFSWFQVCDYSYNPIKLSPDKFFDQKPMGCISEPKERKMRVNISDSIACILNN